MSNKYKLDVFEDDTYILKEDLVDYIKETTSYKKDSSIRWVVQKLVKSGEVTKVDSKHFYKGLLKEYSPVLESPIKLQLKSFMIEKYPNLECVIYETHILNEWLNHQIARNVIFVEVEKFYMEDVFTSIRESFTKNILLNPTEEDYYLYADNDSVVISNLISRAPRNKDSYEIKLEKLIVDLFSNDLLTKLFSQSEVETILDNLFKMYKLNLKTAFAYAKRRNLLDITQRYLKKYDPSKVKND